MNSPVDTLKALRDRAAMNGMHPEAEALDAAIAALSGGEAEPFAWAPAGMADPRFAEQHFTVSRFQIAPDSIPLYTTPRIPDGMVLVPREPTYQMAEAMGVKWESGEGFPARYRAMLSALPGDGSAQQAKPFDHTKTYPPMQPDCNGQATTGQVPEGGWRRATPEEVAAFDAKQATPPANKEPRA